MRIIRFLLGTTTALTIALLLLVLPMPAPARAVSAVPASSYSIGVTTTTDEYDVTLNSTCSLREAVKTANNAADFGGCTRVIGDGSGADTILLPSGTYTLTLTGWGEDFDATGDLDIRNSMSISSTGATHPIVRGGDLGWADRIFHIVTGNVTFKGLFIRGGHVGAANGGGVRIESGQSLAFNDGEVANSSASDLGFMGFANGGGIYNSGTATLANVTLSGNHASGYSGGAGAGGGIYNSGTATLTNVTLSGNSAFGFSGSAGGGIFHISGTLTLINVTLNSNSAGSSGGGIYWTGSGTGALTNTIVANNSGGNCGSALGGSFNLSSDGTCGFGAGRDNINVMLAPLGNYGGSTLTHMLLPGGPAIDFGTNTGCPLNDQRGYSRPVNGTCDVGAVERQPIDFSYWLNLPLILR